MAQLTSETTKTSSIAAKAESKVRDPLGINLLHLAISKRDAAKVASLLEAKGDINSTDMLGDTPIQIAARIGDVPVIETLLKAKADAHSTESDNSTLLHIVARAGNVAAITPLIKANINVDLGNHAGDTPLMSATLKGHIPAIIALIKEKATINLRNHIGFSALHIAVCFGNVAAVNELIKARADITPQDLTGGETPLLTAADKGHAAVVNALLNAKAPHNSKTTDGDYVLHFAARNGNLETISALLKAKANLNSPNKNGHTPLQTAIYYRNTAAANALIEANADIDLTNNFGDTPLHVAAGNGTVETILSLIKAKAQLKKKNGFGHNALHVAAATGHTPAIIALLAAKIGLQSKGLDRRTALHIAAVEGRHQTIDALFEAKADLNARDSLGDTALMLAVKHQKLAVVRILMKNRADANLKDNRGMVALQLTTTIKKPEEALAMVKLLLGANEEASPPLSALGTSLASTTKKSPAAASLPKNTRKKDEDLLDAKVNIAAAIQDPIPPKLDIKDAKSPVNLSWTFSSGSHKVNLALEQIFSVPKAQKDSLPAPKKKTSILFNKQDNIPHTTYIINIVNQAFIDIAHEKYKDAEKKLLSVLSRLKERMDLFKKNKTLDSLQHFGEISCNYYLSLCANKTAHLENEQLYGNNFLALLPKAINLLVGNGESPQLQQLQRIKVEFETRKLALQESIKIKKASLAKTVPIKKIKSSASSTIPVEKPLPLEEPPALPEIPAQAIVQEEAIVPLFIPESAVILPAVPVQQEATIQLTQKIVEKEQYLLALINGKAQIDDMDIALLNQQIKTLSQDLITLASLATSSLQSRVSNIATYAKTIYEIFNTKKQVTKHINEIEKNIANIALEITALPPSDSSGNIDMQRRQLTAMSRTKYAELEEWQNKLAKLVEITEAYAENPAPNALREAKTMQSSVSLAAVITPATVPASPSSLPWNNEVMPRSSRPSATRMPYPYHPVAPSRQRTFYYTPPAFHNGPRQFLPQPIHPAPMPTLKHYAPPFGMANRPTPAFLAPRHLAEPYPAGSYAQMLQFSQPQQISRRVDIEPKASFARRGPPPGLSLPPISTTADNKQSQSPVRDSSSPDLQIGRVSTGKGSSFFSPSATSKTIAKVKEKVQDAPSKDVNNPTTNYS